MKKILLALLCFVSTAISAQIMEPIFLSDDFEYTTQGYRIHEEIVKDIETATGIVNFGRVKDFDIKNAYSFTGEGDRAEFVDGFMFEFVPKDDKKYGHNVFEAYAKALWDQCAKVADDGQLKNSSWADAKVLTFAESIRVVDKKQDRKKASWYYTYKGEPRYIEIIERRFSEEGFGELYVQMKHM